MDNSESSRAIYAIYAMHAPAVPVWIEAYKLSSTEYRIKMLRGIGWLPTVYRTEQDVLAQILKMRSYGVAEATMCKSMCTADP